MENKETEQIDKSDEQLFISAIVNSAFFKNEMKHAFIHGRNYEQLDTNGCDIDVNNVEDKHLPFSEWFAKHYINS